MAQVSDADPTLPWPECLGAFDEESCRYFLRELGQRMVQFYPFTVGIEEVHSQILDEYGFDGAPDAMSVLQELLEDDSTAAGAGDDGDIWRSWRHSWRHRNDNPGNPFVARARGHILGPPTSIRVRILKNANFVTRQLNQAKSHARRLRVPSPEVSNGRPLPDTSLSSLETGSRKIASRVPSLTARDYHESLCNGIAQKHGRNTSSGSSQQDSKDVSDERVLLPSHKYDAARSSPRLRSSSIPTAQPSLKYGFPFSLASPRRRSGTTSPRPDQSGSLSADVILEEEGSVSIPMEAISTTKSPITTVLEDNSDLGAKQTPSSAHIGGDRINRYSLPSDLSSTDREATPTKRRASHRQARMIDGALFHGKTRKGKFVESDSVGASAGSAVKENSENEIRRLSGQSTKQHQRGSWLHNVWTRLHGEHRRHSSHPKLRKKHSSLTNCGLIGSPPSSSRSTLQPGSSKFAEMTETTPTPRFGLDGICEERLNKPLPLSPGELHRPSIQSDIHRTFFGRNPRPVLLSSASDSPVLQQYSSSHKDVDLSSLVSATMSGPHELSPKEKSWRYRLSDSSSKLRPASPASFATFASKNPYHNTSEPSTPTTPVPPPPLDLHKQKILSTEWPFRAPQDLQRHDTVDGTRVGDLPPSSYGHNIEPSHESTRPSPTTGSDRGRPSFSPMMLTTPQDSRFRASPPKTPPPRSRSPVKRLIGMVKSMSTNQMSDNAHSATQDTPASANKRKWKELSNKVRHGFLTADLAQLEQEEMMEQYSSNGDIQILTPPPSHPRFTPPVSIKSSGQSKLWSELEYMLIKTCNTFLKDELEHDRLSRESIIRAKRQWQARSRPQVIEFYYDQATQYEIIIDNLRTIKLYSDYAEDAITLNAILHQWKILIRELSVKTLCMPDSIVRRWLHDGRRVLELLGAPQITLAHLDRLSGLCFAVFGSAEKQRAKQRSRADTTDSHRRSASDGSQNTLLIHEQALLNHGMSGSLQVPPLPTPRSTGNGARKVTPQEQRIAQQARKSTERDRSALSGGRGASKSLSSAERRTRFPFN